MRRDDQKCDIHKIAKRIVKTNCYINGEQCIKIDDGMLIQGNSIEKL